MHAHLNLLQLRDQLEQRRVAMRALCVKAEAKVKELREREAQSRAQIKEHVDRYTAWHAIQLRQVCVPNASVLVSPGVCARASVCPSVYLVCFGSPRGSGTGRLQFCS